MSLVETFMVAFDISSDQRFIRDSDGDPYFGTVTHFISYLWGVEFKVLIDAIDTTRQRSDGATQVGPHGQRRASARVVACDPMRRHSGGAVRCRAMTTRASRGASPKLSHRRS